MLPDVLRARAQQETMAPMTPAGPDEEAFARLVRWVERAGGHVGPLGLGRGASGRHVYARAHIASNQRVLEVPRSHLMTVEAARASDIGRRIAAAGVAPRGGHTWLAAHLLQETRARKSFWRPYLDLLPESYRHVPVVFDERELALLRGSFTLDRIRDRRDALAREHDELCRRVPAFRAYGYDAFVWAQLTVASRVFGLTIDGEATQALVPIADLLDHKLPRETTWGYAHTAGAFHITALEARAPGDPVFDSYGHKCNSRFFLNYGFALPDNPDNEARIVIPQPGGGAQVFLVPASGDAGATVRMLSFLRHVSAPRDASPAAGEEAALIALAAACRKALAAFETTLAEDDALLARPETEGNLRSIVLMRRGEKQVLHAFIELARAAIPLLRLPPAEARRVAEGRYGGTGRFDPYLREVALDLAR